MLRFSGLVRVGAVLGLVLAGVTPAMGASTAAPPAGPKGPRTLLQDTTQLFGYDVATDAAGNGYVGWISDDSASSAATRKVRLCYLPAGSSTCTGVQQIDALGASSASGLKVVAGAAGATLAWFHDTTPGSVNGPRGGRVATATVTNGVLSPAADYREAASFGQLLDAQAGPDGTLWTVTYKGVGTSAVEVSKAAGSYETVPTPYSIGKAELAFAGGTPVLAVTQYGSISTAISTSHQTNGAWSGFAAVPNTWSVGTLGLAAAGGSVHLVASIGNASYQPVVAHFTGSGFTGVSRTGDTNPCSPSSHDLVSDASGRLADVSNECGRITVANQPQRGRAALFRFDAGSTVAGGDPQIATTPRGYGWVAWSTQSSVGNKLQVTRVLLPALPTTKSRRSASARVKVTGPASCLPPVRVAVGANAKGRHGWSVDSVRLRLDGSAYGSSVLDGSKLTPGSLHTLTTRAAVSRGGSSATRSVSLTFRSCPTP